MEEYIINCYCHKTYKRFGGTKEGGFPENTYVYNTKEEALNCLRDLINNDNSGIWMIELIQERFMERE